LVGEIQEIRDVPEAFNAAVKAWEMTGFKDDGMRSHDGAHRRAPKRDALALLFS
jgi:hypothetical protein